MELEYLKALEGLWFQLVVEQNYTPQQSVLIYQIFEK